MKTSTRHSIVTAATTFSVFVERLAAYPCIAATGAMTIVVLLGVFFRYVIQQPLSWSEEVARYLMIWAASLAVSIGIMKREHIGITLFIHTLPAVVQRYLAVVVNLLVLWFLWILTKYGYYMAVEGKSQLSPILAQYGITMVWSLSAIPVAGALAIVQTILRIPIELLGEKAEEADIIKDSVDI